MPIRQRWYLYAILAALTAGIATYVAIKSPSSDANPVAPVRAAAVPPADSTLEIIYIANEGVLISSGNKQVLIDGLHREYKPAYAYLPDAEREAIETAREPFNGIDLVLVSHLHLDHFHPEAVGLHLQHNPAATLVTSQQVIDEVEKSFAGYSAIQPRITSATPPLGGRVPMTTAGIDYEILGLGHANKRFDWIQNLGHVIHLGGKTLLHVGDAAANPETFDAFDLDEMGIDIAFLPSWFLMDEEGHAFVRQYIQPEHVIVVHVSPDGAKKTADAIERHAPDADVFTTMLERRHF